MSTMTVSRPATENVTAKLSLYDILLRDAIEVALHDVKQSYTGYANEACVQSYHAHAEELAAVSQKVLRIPLHGRDLLDLCRAQSPEEERERWDRFLATIAVLRAIENK